MKPKKFDRKKPFMKRPKKCYFTVNKISYIDYKDAGLLLKFVNDRGKIKARKTSGVSTIHQRDLARAIKRSRHMGLMPFVKENKK